MPSNYRRSAEENDEEKKKSALERLRMLFLPSPEQPGKEPEMSELEKELDKDRPKRRGQ